MLEIKQKGNRYYRFSRSQMRSFPIKKSEALAKIKNGEAYMVEYFITDNFLETPAKETTNTIENVEVVEEVKEEVKNENVVSFADKLKKKQEENELQKAKNQFLNNILPNMNKNDMMKILSIAGDSEKFQEEMMRITLRISIEKDIK